MEIKNEVFIKMMGFLEKLSGMKYPDADMFRSLLFGDFAKVDSLLDMYDILEEPYPSWVRAYLNSHDDGIGRSEAIEDIVSNYLTMGELS
jgi:hypothetical protein